MEVPTLTRSWSMTGVFEPSHAVRAVTVAKRREYTEQGTPKHDYATIT